MSTYRLYFFHPRTHGIVRFEELEADSDERAIEAVQSYSGPMALELWLERRKVHSVEANDLASRVVALRCARAQEELAAHQLSSSLAT